MSDVAEGTQIGPYRIVRKLGEGGMGAVFEAVHNAIGRHVAIKVLHAEYAARQDVVGRFFNEAKAANLIDHPSIVQVADFGHTEDRTAYIVMEFLRGEALSKRLRKGALQPSEAVGITRQIASALAAAHDKGIVHRDLKPDNVMLIPDPEHPGTERLKLLDFGIAKLMEAEQAGQVKTRTNMVMGTPGYMSPEQCRGASRVDAQADVYSLGVMLYEMLSGRLPFVAEDSGSLIGMHLFMEAPPLRGIAPQVPEQLAVLTHRLLLKDKAQRPTMRELVTQLQALAESGAALSDGGDGSWLASVMRSVMPRSRWARHSTLDFSTGESGHGRPPRTRRRQILLAAGLAGIATVLTVITLVAPSRRHPDRVKVAAAPPVPAAVSESVAAQPQPPTFQSPRKVEWEILSDPPGAEIIRVDDNTVLGKTPLSREQVAQPGKATLKLRLAGYQPVQVVLDQERSGQVDKRLVLLPFALTTGSTATSRPRARLNPAPAAPTASMPAQLPKPVETPHDPPRAKTEELLEK